MKTSSVTLDLPGMLELLEMSRQELEREFNERYQSLVQNIVAITKGVDAATALATVDEDREELDRHVRDLNAVAQLGITVEIIGHELEALDSDVTRYLDRLPAGVRATEDFRHALDAHRALTEKLRFLSPLQLAGARMRETLTGGSIAEYVRDFFGSIFADNGISFESTVAFEQIAFIETKTRVYRVLINRYNNSIYLLSRYTENTIKLYYIDGKIVVGDTGVGVYPDDLWRLFQLIYTKRNAGRGAVST